VSGPVSEACEVTVDSGQDYAVVALTDDGRVRVLAARTTRLAEQARRRHDASPTAAAALGRALTGAALLGMTLKDRGTVTLRLLGDGPLGGLIAEADASGNVRGYAKNPSADLPPTPAGKLDVGGLIGRRGFCHVTRDMGLREPYTGSSPLVSGEVGEDLTRYLAESEQTPSAVALGVLVDRTGVIAAGGLFVQLLPPADNPGAPSEPPDPPAEADPVETLETALAGMKSVSRLIEAGLRPEDLVRLALGRLSYRLLEARPLRFSCRCSRERALDTLASLGRQDLADLVRAGAGTGDGAELVCRFCGAAYHFTREELRALLREPKHPPLR